MNNKTQKRTYNKTQTIVLSSDMLGDVTRKETQKEKKKRLQDEKNSKVSFTDKEFYNLHHVISFSGGKDSTALLLKAIEYKKQGKIKTFEVIFCDTGAESHHTYAYIRYIEYMLKIKITRLEVNFYPYYLKCKNSQSEKLQKIAGYYKKDKGNAFNNMLLYKCVFPNGNNMRFCSSTLKELPCKFYELELIKQGKQPLLWTGIRREESRARENTPLFSSYDYTILKQLSWYKNKAIEMFGDFIFKEPSFSYCPLINYTVYDIWETHFNNDILRNKIYTKYDNVFKRSSCMQCIFSGMKERKMVLTHKSLERERERYLTYENMLTDINGKQMHFYKETTEQILAWEKKKKKISVAPLFDNLDENGEFVGSHCESGAMRCEI